MSGKRMLHFFERLMEIHSNPPKKKTGVQNNVVGQEKSYNHEELHHMYMYHTGFATERILAKSKRMHLNYFTLTEISQSQIHNTHLN